jgi:uncharacterized protein (DUF849 family)
LAKKVVITCALNGGHDPKVNRAIPITPEQIAQASVDAWKAGAAVIHLHVRDPKTTLGSMDIGLYRETMQRIRDKNCDAIINLTTGTGALFYPDDEDPRIATPESTLRADYERLRHIEELRPEMGSLPMGSMNRGGPIYFNSDRYIVEGLRRFRLSGVKPELDIADAGQIILARELISKGLVDLPPVFQFCLGWPSSAPATPESIVYLKSLLPEGSAWQAFGRGLISFPVAALSILNGGNVRVGLEDSPWISEGKLAPSNTALVEKVVSLMAILDAEPATVPEARKILSLRDEAILSG